MYVYNIYPQALLARWERWRGPARRLSLPNYVAPVAPIPLPLGALLNRFLEPVAPIPLPLGALLNRR